MDQCKHIHVKERIIKGSLVTMGSITEPTSEYRERYCKDCGKVLKRVHLGDATTLTDWGHKLIGKHIKYNMEPHLTDVLSSKSRRLAKLSVNLKTGGTHSAYGTRIC